jgi:AmmeMemoRadiSam system protein A
MPGGSESEIVTLARASIERLLSGEEAIKPVLVDPSYPRKAGAFVSLHRGGQLRGCIGTIGPTCETLAEEVAENAVRAATEDPRFSALSPTELTDLDIKVDVLHAPENCVLADLDPARYGVIVVSGCRRGLLLPDLEGVEDVPKQVSIARQKAGIPEDAACSLQRFLVDRYV